MGCDYALVHVKYTIPPAIALSVLYRPLMTYLDVYKILFLITIAVVSTIPWDSYLIRHRIWTYPPNAIVGPTLFDIPAEEVFFFVIQTYTTSLLYLILNKATFHPVYLSSEREGGSPADLDTRQWRLQKYAGQAVLLLGLSAAWAMFNAAGTGTYMGLIVGWAFPFLLFLWTLAYQLLIGLPWTNTVLPVLLPTVYLWIVDTIALRRGTWVIESGTKLGIHLWPGLEIEEAFFFLATNMLIVFGMVAFDNALAVLHTFCPSDWVAPHFPSAILLMRALLTPVSQYDDERIAGLREAVSRLRKKSRSFYLASGAFQGKLRIDLIILYSFCRVADDLVDDTESVEEARMWIDKMQEYLDMNYSTEVDRESIRDFVEKNFPAQARSALLLLPTSILSKQPLYDLLKGFEMDLEFSTAAEDNKFPIETVADLDLYGARVAGTVAELCLDLVFADCPHQTSLEERTRVLRAGALMGIALQFVNISRDISVDAEMNRVYIPSQWLSDEGLTPEDVIKNPTGPKIESLRKRLLERAFILYEDSKDALDKLPFQAKGPMRVAVESYMEIGRVLGEGKFPTKRGKATVPKLRRMIVAWRALS
ncbi:terpene cyclase [Venturia effusa]|uniref:Bifunctional lycopene cyclase/phytoene synthase n=1 Tax=Venturia effusa TaxID=50376 RepID=A0A517KWG4_9PEZI|nr:terpene cyclase [Venturia effusa]